MSLAPAPTIENAPATSLAGVSATPAPDASTSPAPLLLLCTTRTSGTARRVEGYLAHILQRRHNHQSFRYSTLDVDERPDLARKLGVTQVPTVLVVGNGHVLRRVEGTARPAELEDALGQWLH